MVTTSVDICYDDSKLHSLVEVAGEFSQWAKLPLAHHPAPENAAADVSTTQYKRTVDNLVPGDTYMYKFIVDGEWLLASDGRPFSK